MYLSRRDEMTAPDGTPASLVATSVLSALGWASFFFLLAVFVWFNYKWRQDHAEAESVREDRASLAEAVTRKISEIESLQHDLELRDMIIANGRQEDGRLRHVPADVFVVGDNSDSDSDSESDSDNDEMVVQTSSYASAFTTSLQPAPVLIPAESAGNASADGEDNVAGEDNASGETKEIDEDREVQGVQRTTTPPATSPAVDPSLSPRSLAYELALAEADEDSASETCSARPSAEVR